MVIKGRLGPVTAGLAAVALLVSPILMGCQPSQSAAPAPTAAAAAAPTQAPPTRQAAPTQAPAVQAAPTQAATAAAAAAPAAQTIRIGLAVALTGPAGNNGLISDRLMRMAIDDVNAKGGFKVGDKTYKFEAAPTADAQNTPDGGRAAADRLVLNEKVKFILGPFPSPASAMAPITEANKVLLLAYGLPDELLSPKFPLVFGVGTSIAMMGFAAIDEFAKAQPNLKRMALLRTDDSAGRGYLAAQVARAQQRGMEIVAQEFYPIDIKDYNPVVVRVLQAKPDAIDLGATGGHAANLLGSMKSIRAQGFKGPVITHAADPAPLKEGGEVMEGLTTSILLDYDSPNVTSADRDMLRRYFAAYGRENFGPVVMPTFVAPLILAQGMQMAGTVDDTEKIAAALRKSPIELPWSKDLGKVSFSGTKSYGINSVLETPIYLSKVVKGVSTTYGVLLGSIP